METRELHGMDYQALSDLARSRNIHVVEAVGLDTRRGIRFFHEGSEWIAVDSSLSDSEKVRTLGFLLKQDQADIAARAGLSDEAAGSSTLSPVLTLCC